MKKLIFILLLTIANFVALAQLKPYQPNPILDKFIGTWIAQTGTKTITIIIKKIQVPLMNTKADQLEGYLLHDDSGAIVEESDTPTLTLGANVSEDGKIYQDKVFFSYYDRKKGKTGRIEVSLSETNPNEFTTLLSEQEHTRIINSSTPKRQNGFTLPNKLTFKKHQ